MTDLIPNPPDTYGDSHNWRSGEPHQWGRYGGKARTQWVCLDCKVNFVHYYHDVTLIRDAMRHAKIPDQCTGVKDE
jgi:hypothetical protein